MTTEQYYKNLKAPDHKVDVILDTDAYNEVDDQFAIAYLVRSEEMLNPVGFTAAPYLNSRSVSPEDGMLKSYDEIFKVLRLAGREDLTDRVFKGATHYMPDEKTPVLSDAVTFMIDEAKKHSPENPLYIVSIGCFTNLGSALIVEPSIKENIVSVVLGGNGLHTPSCLEFNMQQDVAAARVIFGCKCPLVQLPANGVVDHCRVSGFELEHYLVGKNPLADYLARNTIDDEGGTGSRPWTRVIWDICGIAWLLNGKGRFISTTLINSPIPGYDNHYGFSHSRHFICYAYNINRDEIYADLFAKLLK